jgi:hypothetical protein
MSKKSGLEVLWFSSFKYFASINLLYKLIALAYMKQNKEDEGEILADESVLMYFESKNLKSMEQKAGTANEEFRDRRRY